MNDSIRTLAAALAFATVGVAQANEVSDPPQAMSMKARSDVAAEARRAPVTNEMYDGRDQAAATAQASSRQRTEVRAEARLQATSAAASLYVGG